MNLGHFLIFAGQAWNSYSWLCGFQARKNNDEVTAKNGELARVNTDLRHKVNDLEFQVKQQKDKISSIKTQTEHLQKIRQKQDLALDGYKVGRNWVVCVGTIHLATSLPRKLYKTELRLIVN